MHLLHTALIHTLLSNELDFQGPADGRPRVLDLQQRVMHQMLATPHLDTAQCSDPSRYLRESVHR